MALKPRTGRYDDADWVPTRALRRSVVVTAALLLAAAITGRPDVVVLAAPFAIGMAVALRNRPRRLPDGVVSTEAPFLTEGGEVQVQISLANQDQVAYDLAVVRTHVSPWLDVVNTDRPLVTPVPPSGVVDVDLVGLARRWGHQAVGPLQVSAAACGAMMESRPIVSEPLLLRVLPQTDQFKAVEAMPKAAGLVGVHRSRRYGDGGELAGIRQFSSGDRLRRIDWRTSLRTRELHVAHTLSDRDAELVLLLDVLHEVGQPWALDPSAQTAPLLADGSRDATPTVLDTTVRAAAALAQYYLDCGDRVSMVEYGAQARWLRAGSGRRQYLAALEWLLDVTPSDAEYDPVEGMLGSFGRHVLPPRALVVVLTPLLESRSAGLLVRLARAGRTVVAVDTLPPGLQPTMPGMWGEVGYRLWMLDRENTKDQLLEHGVPVVPWAGAGSLDQVLRDVSRMGATPRAVVV